VPREGAAILSQVEGLLEQFLALDYYTPVKTDVEAMLTHVRENLDKLRADATDVTETRPEEEPDDNDPNEGKESDEMDDSSKPEGKYGGTDFRDARKHAHADMMKKKKAKSY